eukprot:1101717-Alexandrium_andersonii.AAC.1
MVLAGVIARPLYKRTEIVDEATGLACKNVASMSRFLEQSEGRPAYKCKDCIAKAGGAVAGPGSASLALR